MMLVSFVPVSELRKDEVGCETLYLQGSRGMEKHAPHCAQRDVWGTKRSGLGEEGESSFVGRTCALTFCSGPLSTATLLPMELVLLGN